MLSLDLFDSKFEKRLHEGAVDDAEYARLKKLGEKIDYLKQARRQSNDPEMQKAIDNRIAQYDNERREILSVRGMKEAQQPQQPPAKGLLKGKDLVTPQQRVAGATPAKPGVAGAVKDVVGGVKRWLKGEPDQGPTYEDQELEEQQPQLSKRGQGIQNMKNLQVALDNDYAEVIFQFQGGVRVATNAEGMDILVDYYNGMDSAGRTNFVYNVLGDNRQFTVLCRQLGVELTPIPVQQLELPLNEKRSQKKKFKSAIAQREVEKALASYPTAASPVEAFLLKTLDVDDQQNKTIQNLQKELQAVKSARPQVTPAAVAPVSAAPAPVSKPAQPTTPTSKIMGIGPVAEPKAKEPAPAEVPQVKDLPKSDQRILQKVRSIEKRLRDRVDQYQTAQALKDTTPERLAKMQQQIDDLTAQRQSQTEKLSDQGQQVIDVEAIPVLGKPNSVVDFTQRLARRQSQDAAQNVPIQSREQEPIPAQLKRVSGSDIEEHGGGIGPKKHWQDLMQETVTDVRAGMAEIYRRLAPKIERHRDSFLAGQLYDELENYAELHGAEKEFRRMMATARNRAHMEYDMNPGGFHNWFWFLPFEDKNVEEGWSDQGNPTPYSVYIDGREWKGNFSYEQARAVADKVKTNLERQGRKQTVTIAPSKSKRVKEATADQFGQAIRMASHTGRDLEKDPETHKEIVRTQQQLAQRKKNMARRDAGYGNDPDEYHDIDESIKDVASATAVIACLLTGGSLTGCATAPQQTTNQQVLNTGQDVARTMQTAKNITRASVEAEVNQEIKNLARGMGARPEELNNSTILRLWRRFQPKPPVPVEPEAPEYGPAAPVKRMPQYEAKEIKSKQDYDRAVDSVMNQLARERNSAVIQMLQAQLKVLQDRGRVEGWHKDRVIREDTAALAAEDAILKRIFVKHKNLMMEYGTDKITQAAESVAYNVGDIAHITDEQITEWVGQVEYILGARP